MADDLPVLDDVEQRLLGCLLEKQRTVPAGYPLTLNALRAAANQTSSRDPVVDYDEATITEALRGLKDRDLVRFVWTGRGSRVLKYHQRLDEQLGLGEGDAAVRAVLTVLLLRGPQTAGEVRARTERLHTFADRDAVERTLAELASAPLPLVRELPRRPGQHDTRWIHLLGPVPVGPAGGAAVTDAADAQPAVDLDRVLAGGAAARDAKVRTAWDAVAEPYLATFADELAYKPFDRWLLQRLRDGAGPGPIVDVGTGSGHIAAFLAEEGAEVHGIDLSPRMVEVASRTYGEVAFRVGSFADLMRPPRASGWALITAWYALVHTAPSELPGLFRAWARTLDAGGWIAVGLHLGSELGSRSGGELVQVEELLGTPVDVEFVRHDAATVNAAFAEAGLRVREWYVRGPVPSEHQTPRYYAVATLD